MSDDGKGYEMGRLMRGAQRPIHRLGPMHFVVKGNDRPRYYVNLEEDVPCDCEDAVRHGRPCLHEIAARLQNGDTGLVNALADALGKAMKRNEELERQTRKSA